MKDCHHLIVLTGGPGSGKTSLLNALNQNGYRIAPEAGRNIIQQQKSIHGTALPEINPLCFAEAMLTWDLRNYMEADASKDLTFFDRGLPDLIGYLRLMNLDVPTHFFTAAHTYRYRKQVFIAPYWDEIYHQDQERKQNKDEAEATCLHMRHIYHEMGYELVELPFTDIEGRVNFILTQLAL